MLLIFLLVCGVCALYYGGDFLIRGALGIGEHFKLSPMIVGLVFVALGTSAPELAVSVAAAVQGHGDMAAGNVIGSNIVNITLVLGIAAFIGHLTIGAIVARREIPLLFLLTFMAVLFLADGTFTRWEGVTSMLIMAGALAFSILGSHRTFVEPLAGTEQKTGWQRSVLFVLAGIALLIVGAESMIYSGVGLATALGVSEAVIALTVTSVGTGIPEIAATIIAAAKRNTDIAIGNIIGSNFLNIGLVLGLSGTIVPLNTAGLGWIPLLIVLGLTSLLWVVAARVGYLSRWMGISLLLAFGCYNVILIA